MESRLDEFLRQAKSARERAESADGEFRTQWLRVAEMWDLLAREFQIIQRRNDSGVNAGSS